MGEQTSNLLTNELTTDYGSFKSARGFTNKDKIVSISYPDRKDVLHKTSNFATFMHIARGNIGTGLLALPSACLSAGLWVGTIGIFLIGLCCVYCMHLLIKSSHTLCARTKSVSLDYGDVMEKAFLTSPSKLNKFSKCARNAVNVFVVITQLGFCSIYIIFIASNIKYAVHHSWLNDPDVRLYMLMVLAVLLPYVLIKHLKILAVFSMAGNILYIVAYVIVMQYVVRDLPDVSQHPAFNSTRTLPLFLGSVFYTFEGIGSLLPIENKMATPADLSGWTGVLNLAMITATCIYTATGFYGYLRFGNSIQGSISLNLPTDNWLYLSVNVMFAAVMAITFALMYYVPHTILWPRIKQKLRLTNHEIWMEPLFRILVICFTGVLAIVVPHLDLLISFVGAAASSFLAIIFPALLDIIVRHADKTLSVPFIILDSLLLCLGVIGCGTGSVVSLMEIIQRF